MSREFVVIVRSTESADVKNAVTATIEALGMKYWHWIDNVWLLAEHEGLSSAKQLYEKLCSSSSLIDEKTVIIFTMGEKKTRSYWGRSGKDSWEWMVENWGSAN